MSLVDYGSDSSDDQVSNSTNKLIPVKVGSLEHVGTSIGAIYPERPTGRAVAAKFVNAEKQAFDAAIFKRKYHENEFANRGAVSNGLQRKQKRAKGEGLDYLGPWAKHEPSESSSSSEEDSEEEEEEMASKVEQAIQSSPEPEVRFVDAETSEFVGSSERDYLGRTYMHVPQDLDINLSKDPDSFECFAPKSKFHTFLNAHRGGVTALRYMPNSGHLILSTGNDGLVKLWDAYHKHELLRKFHTPKHSVGKDVYFSPDGTKFLSAAYDGLVREWDTESGVCLNKFTSTGGRGKSNANVVRYNPFDPHSFVAGMSDSTILQWDTREPEKPTQTYDHHLSAVNSITFLGESENGRFLSTSDDRSVRFWDWSINVPIKFIAEPTLQSMPSTTLQPGGKYVVARSLDNTVKVIYGTEHRKYRLHRSSEFRTRGILSGNLDFSADGKFLYGGDSEGHLCVWKYSSKGNSLSTLKGHDSVLSIAASPQETSKVITGGKEGSIIMWD